MRVARIFFDLVNNTKKTVDKEILSGFRKQFGNAGQDFVLQRVPTYVELKSKNKFVDSLISLQYELI
jgi:hypothetical protein